MAKSSKLTWVFDSRPSGTKLSEAIKQDTQRRILLHAEQHYAGQYSRIDVRFRGQFCYIDAYKEPDPSEEPISGSGETVEQYRERLRTTPIHLCRLGYSGRAGWTLGFYRYSHSTYERSRYPNGTFFGSPEEGFDVGALYLQR